MFLPPGGGGGGGPYRRDTTAVGACPCGLPTGAFGAARVRTLTSKQQAHAPAAPPLDHLKCRWKMAAGAAAAYPASSRPAASPGRPWGPGTAGSASPRCPPRRQWRLQAHGEGQSRWAAWQAPLAVPPLDTPSALVWRPCGALVCTARHRLPWSEPGAVKCRAESIALYPLPDMRCTLTPCTHTK